ncbi:hypothetical protein [Pseudomonas protegens]|uniref:hypothetical protein n=1 Tax=Pseudomonas protegens TaxID=380021 RepID=UPI00149430E1|nr:hypothetical protein [Pseudomonas protegens]
MPAKSARSPASMAGGIIRGRRRRTHYNDLPQPRPFAQKPALSVGLKKPATFMFHCVKYQSGHRTQAAGTKCRTKKNPPKRVFSKTIMTSCLQHPC